jgi:hypothetical protein
MNDSVGEFPTALLPRLGLKPEANSQNHDQQVGGVWNLTIEQPGDLQTRV